jgi:TRAP-type mannitol/chloroaromatic compound transport system permease small subunit
MPALMFDAQSLFDPIGGPKQLPLYAFLAAVPVVLVMFGLELRSAMRRVPATGGGSDRLLYAVDALSAAAGKTFGWAILVLTFSTSYEVFARYMFGAPTDWAFDTSYILYGALFMMAGAYTLSRNGHVRGDFIYRAWAPRRQALMDLILYILFFFPGMLAFIYAGYNFAELSRRMNEHSSASPNGPIVWPFKWLIPVVGTLMVLQGVVEVFRCIKCIRAGEWPARLHDVEELEKVMLSEAEQKKAAEMSRAEEAGMRKGDI